MEAMQEPDFWQILKDIFVYVKLTAIVATLVGVVVYYKTKSFLWANISITGYFYLGASFIAPQAISQTLFVLLFVIIIANITSIVIEIYLEKFVPLTSVQPKALILTKNNFNPRALYRLRK